MEPIKNQKQANKFFEGGIFYPTGYVVAAFATADVAKTVRARLVQAGFAEEHVMVVNDLSMAREAQENLDSGGMLSAGASFPARQKQLELAREGCHFVMAYAPEDADEQRALQAIEGLEARYAVKYRGLVIENLIGEIDSAPDSEPARVP